MTSCCVTFTDPRFFAGRLEVSKRSAEKFVVEIFQRDGITATGLAADDVAHVFIWQDDDQDADIHLTEAATNEGGGYARIIELGAQGLTPAKIEVFFGAGDVDHPVGTYKGQVGVTDTSGVYVAVGEFEFIITASPLGDRGNPN